MQYKIALMSCKEESKEVDVMRHFARSILESALETPRGRNFCLRSLSKSGVYAYSDFGDHRFVYDPSEFIGRTIFDSGGFQRDVVKNIVELVARFHSGQFGVLLEVGANIGTTTVYAALTSAFNRIVAIEPDPLNFQLLKANVVLNELSELVELHELAASESDGVAMLTRNSVNSGMSTLQRELPSRGNSLQDQFEVKTRPLDHLLASIGVEADQLALVWMDVEGHEVSAFRGMRGVLEAAPPLFFEFLPQRVSDSEVAWLEEEVLSRYQDIRYLDGRLRSMPAGGLRELSRDVEKCDILALAGSPA